MPHDIRNREIHPGDRVFIEATVESVNATEDGKYCNVTVKTARPMPPYTGGQTIVLNTKQTEHEATANRGDHGLSFAELRSANVARLPEFLNSRGETAHEKPDGSDWSPLEWGGATAGEVGEMCNYLKKLRRGDVTLEDTDMKEGCTIRTAIGREIADAICYLDHVANQLGIDTGEAVREKFNRVSGKIGSKVKL